MNSPSFLVKVRHTSQKKKKKKEKKKNSGKNWGMCVTWNSGNEVYLKQGLHTKKESLTSHGRVTFRASHSQSSARYTNINFFFLTDFFCLVDCLLNEGRNIKKFGLSHLPILLNLCLQISLYPASKKFRDTYGRSFSVQMQHLNASPQIGYMPTFRT